MRGQGCLDDFVNACIDADPKLFDALTSDSVHHSPGVAVVTCSGDVDCAHVKFNNYVSAVPNIEDEFFTGSEVDGTSACAYDNAPKAQRPKVYCPSWKLCLSGNDFTSFQPDGE